MFERSLLVFIIIFLLGPAAASGTDLKIVVAPAAASAYRISIIFNGDRDGSTFLRLPNEWGGQSELYKAIRDLAVVNGSIADTDKPFVKRITHPAGQTVNITYDIVQDFQGPLKNAVRYRPATDESYIHWIGNTVWALPEWDEQADTNISIEWKGFPKTWTIANSFAISKRKQKFKAKLQMLRSAIFVAGDFRLTKTKARSNDVNVAIRGEWQFRDAEIAEMTRRVIETERDFFVDHSQKYYLVTLVPIDEGPNATSFGGTGLTDSFALFATPNASIAGLRGLLAHEYTHNWIPGKLGRMPEPEQSLYWFSEGFTDFYTYELLRRANLLTSSEYVARYNELIREYYMLPEREAPNDRIVKDFWSDRIVQRLPYLRGFLFATNLNAAIKTASGGKHSLDDVIRDLFNASRTSDKELSFEYLATAFKVYLADDPSPMVKRHLIDGELIVPHADALGSGISQETVEIPVFELGFDFDKFAKDKVVADLSPNSAAYAAGLRNGQQRTAGFSLRFGDTNNEVELKVKDAEGEKTVKFVPVARERARIPQYKLD